MNSVVAFCLGLWLGAIVCYIVIILMMDEIEGRRKPHGNQYKS